jgi:hypothetical protein
LEDREYYRRQSKILDLHFKKRDLMINSILLFTGSTTVIIWRIAHLFPTKPVVKGFGWMGRKKFDFGNNYEVTLH